MKKDINHTPKKTPQETSIEKCPLSEARFKAYNVPKKKSKMIFLTEPVKKCRSLSLQNLPSWHLW